MEVDEEDLAAVLDAFDIEPDPAGAHAGDFDVGFAAQLDAIAGDLPVGDAAEPAARRGPAAAARMREAKRKKHEQAKKQKAKSQRQRDEQRIQSIAWLSPMAAQACGVRVKRLRKGVEITEQQSMSFIRLAFVGQKLAVEKQRTLAAMIEKTTMDMLMHRLRMAPLMIAESMRLLRQQHPGVKLLVSFNFEWDEANMSMKSMAGMLTKKALGALRATSGLDR